jgi:hypothetical protein
MSTRVFGLFPLAKSSKPWQRTDTETSLASIAALATVCGIGQRSHARKNSACLNFRDFYFYCIRDGAYKISTIRKFGS